MKANNRRVRLWWAFGVSSLALVHLAAAQEPSQPAATSATQELPAAPTEPVPIPSSDIPSRGDEVSAELRRLEALLEPSYEIEAINTALDEKKAMLVALHGELDGIDPDRVSTRMLEDHRLKWVKFQAQIEGWMSVLAGRWKTLQVEREDLGKTRRQWEKTRVIVASDESMPELLQRIDTILGRLSDMESRIRDRSDAVASTIDRVSRGADVVAEALVTVDTMSAEVRGRWLNRDEPPLWSVAPISEGASLWQDARQAQRYWAETLGAFVEEQRERFFMLLGLFLGFSAVAFLLRHRSRSWPADDRELDAARFVATRPLSAALAFTMVSMVYVVGTPPGPVRDAAALLAIIPVLRLGVGLVPAWARSALYGAVVLFILNRVWELAPDASLLRRLILFFATALALAGAVRLIRSWRADNDAKTGGWRRLATVGLYVAAALLSMSLLVGVLGWSTLAQMLTGATIESVYGAFAWYVLAQALYSVAQLVPRSAIVSVFRSLPRHKPQFNRIVVFLIAAYAITRWGGATLHQFQVYEPIRQKLVAGLSAPLSRDGLDISPGGVLAAILILVSTFLIARFVRFLLREEVLPRVHLPAGADHSIVTVVNYTVIAFGILLAAATAGLNATQLTVVLGSLGVGIGFGLQSVVNNFVSGLILIFERPIKVGDRVQTVDHFGIVTDIGIRASTIRTFDGAEVIVPNGDLVAKEVINWTRSDQIRRVDIQVRVAQGTDPKKVLEILRQLAEAHPLVLATPECSAWMTGFGESSLDFKLFAWARVQDFLTVSSELHVGVTETLQQAGIRIAVPRRDVRSRDEESVPQR